MGKKLITITVFSAKNGDKGYDIDEEAAKLLEVKNGDRISNGDFFGRYMRNRNKLRIQHN